jgi:S-adenosylmethionine-diacylgycerolhomoserine-N-methlytransferase
MSGPYQSLESYYQLHARIYDATRWSFLFGRQAIINHVARLATPRTVLEVGCGTGTNLVALCRAFPAAQISGLDMSRDMLDVARKNLEQLGTQAARVSLLHRPYDEPLRPEQPYDLILFSYSLTMMNPGWSRAIDHAAADVAPDGLVAVVDFHDSPLHLFKRWMWVNHVRMDSHLRPRLVEHFEPRLNDVRAGYAGLWSYLLFIGEKRKN